MSTSALPELMPRGRETLTFTKSIRVDEQSACQDEKQKRMEKVHRGWMWLCGIVLFFFAIMVFFWLVLFSIKPNWVSTNGSFQISKVFWYSALIAVILVIVGLIIHYYCYKGELQYEGHTHNYAVGHGWGWLGAMILWFIIFVAFFWIALYSLHPGWVMANGSLDLNKVIFYSILMAVILIIIIAIIKFATCRS